MGPILFLIYINDLPEFSNFLTLLFADDTTLILSNENIFTLIIQINIEFRKITDYFRANKLSLHPLKTKFIVFSNSHTVRNMNIEIFMNCNNSNENKADLISKIVQVQSTDDCPAIRFLGVYFDQNLNYDYHIKLLNSKLSRALYMIRSAKNFLTQKASLSLYTMLCFMHT